MKPPCACSIRAFERFVQDFTGLSIHRSRPCAARSGIRIPQGRAFTALSKTRQLNHVTPTEADEALLPFDTREHAPAHSSLDSERKQDDLDPQEAKKERGKTEDEWHAEVKIAAPWPQETAETLPQRPFSDVDSGDGHGIVANHGQRLKSADEVSLSGLHAPPQLPSQTPHHSTLPAEPIFTAASSTGMSRIEGRKQRKLQRMQAGTYRVSATMRIQEERAKAQTTSILGLIKAARGGLAQARAGHEDEHASRGSHGATARSKSARVGTTSNAERAKKGEGTTDSPGDTRSDSITRQVKSPLESWAVQKNSLKAKFGEQGWQPRKRLSPDTLDGIRALHASDAAAYTTEVLAEHFKVAPEAIRRILKSKWRPSDDEAEDRRVRWERRGERKWKAMAEQGVRPPAKWRAKGIQTPRVDAKRGPARRGSEYVKWDEPASKSRASSRSERT